MMSELLLIRHGQARFGSSNYDRLSPTGERQARLVGRYLANRGLAVDTWISGDMRRQHETARLALETHDTHGDIGRDSAFDEYDADAVFSRHLPEVLADDPRLPGDLDSLLQQPRLFQKAFERALVRWTETPAASHDQGHDHRQDNSDEESTAWSHFRTRVLAGLARLHTLLATTQRVAVFTSGGPIAVIVAATLDTDARQFVALNGIIHNASITRLVSTRDGWRLTGFNDIAALTPAGDETLVTYR